MTEGVQEWRNPIYNQYNTIDCEVNNPLHGWLPFTASPDDVSENGRNVYNDILASGTPVAEYVPPTLEEQRQRMDQLTQRQMRLGLLAAGYSTNDIADAIDLIPDQMAREMAKVEFQYASSFARLNPSVVAVLAFLGYSPELIDTFWNNALTL